MKAFPGICSFDQLEMPFCHGGKVAKPANINLLPQGTKLLCEQGHADCSGATQEAVWSATPGRDLRQIYNAASMPQGVPSGDTKTLPRKAVVGVFVGVYAYIWVGTLLFYALEFRGLPRRPGRGTYTARLNLTLLIELNSDLDLGSVTLEELALLADRVPHDHIGWEDHERRPSSSKEPEPRVPSVSPTRLPSRDRCTTIEAITVSHIFAATTVATVGWGNVVPRTPAGKVCLMVYAALGIPLILVGMAGLGRTLSAHVSRVLTTLCPGFSTLSYRKAAGLKLVLASVGGSVVWLGVAGVVTAAVEGWSYLDAIYHMFVTLSTIGYGDFIPAMADGDLSAGAAVLGFYVPFRLVSTIGGLTWLATVVAIAKEILEDVLYGDRFATQRVSQVSYS